MKPHLTILAAVIFSNCFIGFETLADQRLATDFSVPPDMVYIPDGSFLMGDSFGEGEPDELPVHLVTLDAFFMGKYEITNGQYCEYLNSAIGSGSIYVTNGKVYGTGNDRVYFDTSTSSSYSQIEYNGSIFSVRTKGGRDMSNDPVVMVNWYGAFAYCNWRSQQEGREQCYDLATATFICDFSKKGYRLPTEAEWEYAARGGLSGKRFPLGDTITHSQANYRSSSLYSYDISPTRDFHPTWDDDGIYPYTSPVGSFAPNGFGLYDVTGNVWEWCNDWYSDTYYQTSPTNNPTGPEFTSYRVVRGGAWGGLAYDCRAAHRCYLFSPNPRYNYLGFRVVLKPEQ